jgi:hypothetical protein
VFDHSLYLVLAEHNGKRVPKRRITVVGINAVEEAQQEPGTDYGRTLFRCDIVLFAQKFLFEIKYTIKYMYM